MNIAVRRRAFTLTEMLFILMLMGVAGLMSARLFTASMRVISSAPQAQDQHAMLDRMSDVLRHDVWNASKIDVPDARTIDLTQSDGANIRLRLRDGEIARAARSGDREMIWTTSIPLRAEREGSSLVLRSAVNGEELRFTSQIIALEGEKR